MHPSEAARFALALLSLEGVGRVTAGRLLSHFPTYAALLRFPREQILSRLKGVSNAAALVERLLDEQDFMTRMEEADSEIARLSASRITLLTPNADDWPRGLSDLTRSLRPVILFCYGHPDALAGPLVSFFARPPIQEKTFETAQALLRHLKGQRIVPVTGASTGFDVVVTKIAGTGSALLASVLVSPVGLARLAPPLRPVASLAVRSGGLLISPFPMDHGPFPHDEKEGALLQAALGDACVFLEPSPDTPEDAAMTWAIEAGRPVFGIPGPDVPLPKVLHRLQGPVDFEWVSTAVQHPG